MFTANREPLRDILTRVASGKVVLPDFQRDWVWDDYRVRELLASVSRGFPVGAVLTLGAGGEVSFDPEVIKGVGADPAVGADFLLDGQQRLTSLYQALLHQGPVVLEDGDKRMDRWYYIDMQTAMLTDEDRESAIISVPEKMNAEQQYEHHMFPTNQLFEIASMWQLDYIDYWDGSARAAHPHGNPVSFFKKFAEDIVYTFQNYKLPVIHLSETTTREAVCTVFEKVNTSGVPLTIFDLATASFAAQSKGQSKGVKLRKDWGTRQDRLHRSHEVLKWIDGVHFLQVIALLKTQEDRVRASDLRQGGLPAPPIGCKKRDILNLRLRDYKVWADKAEHGFVEAAKFLQGEFVVGRYNVPYTSQIVPLAALYAHLGDELGTADAVNKLSRWYWSGVFGEAYGGATETKFAEDLVQVTEYIRGGPEPTRIEQAGFLPARLVTLRTRNSAAYKGVYALQMKSGSVDLMTGQELTIATYQAAKIDIHHVFPVAWCKHNGIKSNVYNSVINKTPLGAKTNKILGGAAPSVYLNQLRKYMGDDEKLRAALATHWLNMTHLEIDNFRALFVERGEHLLRLIGKAMGRRELGSGREVFVKALDGALEDGRAQDVR